MEMVNWLHVFRETTGLPTAVGIYIRPNYQHLCKKKYDMAHIVAAVPMHIAQTS